MIFFSPDNSKDKECQSLLTEWNHNRNLKTIIGEY
jgi:hypothetical protein